MKKRSDAILLFMIIGTFFSMPIFPAEVQFSGMTKTALGATVDSGDFILAEQLLHTNIDGYGTKSAFHVSPTLKVQVDGSIDFTVREAYIDLLTDAGDFRIGKQAVVWGQAEGFFITDIVSPQDLRFFILADFSDIRIGIPALRAQKYVGPFSVDTVWVPFFVPTVFPEKDSPWYTQEMSVIEPYDVRMGSLSDGEGFIKLGYFGSGFNAEIMAGYAWDDQPVLEGTFPTLETVYKRFTVAGGSLSKPIGPVIVRFENAIYINRAFSAQTSPGVVTSIRKNEMIALGGIDWSISGIDLSLQYVGEYVFDYDENIRVPEFQQTSSFRIRKTFLQDYLTLEFFAYVGLDPFDALLRPSISYTIEDGVLLKAGADIFLGDASGRYGRYRDNTLVSVAVSWYF